MNDPPYVFDATAANFDQAVVDASHQQPVLVDFWADWCQPCKMLMPVLDRIVAQMAGQLRLAKVDTDREQELATRMGVRSLPTVRLYVDGRPVGEFMGAQPEQAVREFLAQYLPADDDQVRLQARDAAERGDLDEAERILGAAIAERPEQHELVIDLATVLLAAGRAEDAATALAGLPDDLQRDDTVRRLRGQAEFARRATHMADPEALESRLEKHPAELETLHDLASLRVAQGRFEEALEMLLSLLSRNRQFRDDAARRDMLAVFAILGDDTPTVREYRRRMAAALY